MNYESRIRNQNLPITLQFARFKVKIQMKEVLFLINQNEVTGDGQRATVGSCLMPDAQIKEPPSDLYEVADRHTSE